MTLNESVIYALRNKNMLTHKNVSFAKSTIRIIGYVTIPFNLIVASVLLVVSEVLGFVEEIV